MAHFSPRTMSVGWEIHRMRICIYFIDSRLKYAMWNGLCAIPMENVHVRKTFQIISISLSGDFSSHGDDGICRKGWCCSDIELYVSCIVYVIEQHEETKSMCAFHHFCILLALAYTHINSRAYSHCAGVRAWAFVYVCVKWCWPPYRVSYISMWICALPHNMILLMQKLCTKHDTT